MRRRPSGTSDSATASTSSKGQGLGRNGLRKRRKVRRLSNVAGVVLPAVLKARHTPTKRTVSELVDQRACQLIRNTWRLVRVKTNTLLLEEASVRDKQNVLNRIRQFLPNLKVTGVKKVNNPYLSAQYRLVKETYASRNPESYVQEFELFHCTSQDAVESIVKNNLDWRRVNRSRFGRGNCFSSDADYANCHANRCNGRKRAFIIFKVLVCKKTLGSAGLNILPNNYDTATGGRTNEIIYVKFNDNEFLPLFVAYYEENGELSTSKYYRMPPSWFS